MTCHCSDSIKDRSHSTRKILFLFFIFPLLFLSVVLPNFNIKLTFAAFVLAIAAAITKPNTIKLHLSLVLLAIASFLVTIFYITIGHINGAPEIATTQVLAIYIISPILWGITILFTANYFGISTIIKTFHILTLAACASVALFFFLFHLYGPQGVEFFKSNANVNLKDGYSGATMHVYGSMIFLTGAYFSTPEILKNRVATTVLLSSIFIVAVTSGRSALILSVFIGLLLYLLHKINAGSKISIKSIIYSLISIAAAYPLALGFLNFYNVDLNVIFSTFFNEIKNVGGSERNEQFLSLLEGAENNFGFGSGHGVGVDYIRSEAFPWRYENVWIATLYRVGSAGTLIYIAPFIIYLSLTLRELLKGRLSANQRFMLGGFLCAFLASFTNPYLESISLQWMFIIPPLIYYVSKTSRRPQ